MFNYATNTYKAEVDRWVDGDTVKLRVDLGQSVSVEGSYRLNRLNAPETRRSSRVSAQEKEAGLALKDMLTRDYPKGTELWVSTEKADRYGRYLVELWVPKDDEMMNLNDWLLEQGLCLPYDGKGARPTVDKSKWQSLTDWMLSRKS